jgi:ABC-type glycerol-3-phosphate transport system substrate-binding protein
MLRKFSVALSTMLALMLLISFAAAAAPAELRFLWWESPQRVESIQRLIDEYEKAHPDVSIKLESIPWDEYWQKLPILIAAGRAPDIMFMVSGNVQRYAEMNALLDLREPYVSQEVIDEMYEPHRAMVTYQGKISALPFTLTTVTPFYNKDHAAKAGIEPPMTPENAWTWEEFKLAAAKMKQAAGSPYGVGLGTRDFWLLPFIYQNGGAVLNEARTGSAINSPESEEALAFLQELVTEGIAASPVDQSVGDLFPAGLMPMSFGGHWDMARFETVITDFDYGVTFFPQRKTSGVGLGGDFLAVYSKTPYPKEAAEFVAWLTSAEANGQYIAENYYLSPRQGAKVTYPSRQEEMNLAQKQAELASVRLTADRAIPAWDKFLQVIHSEFQMVMIGDKKPADGLKAIESAINKALQ